MASASCKLQSSITEIPILLSHVHLAPPNLQSHIESGHVGARVRRWARCMERSSAVGNFDSEAQANGHAPNGNATWQELLRR